MWWHEVPFIPLLNQVGLISFTNKTFWWINAMTFEIIMMQFWHERTMFVCVLVVWSFFSSWWLRAIFVFSVLEDPIRSFKMETRMLIAMKKHSTSRCPVQAFTGKCVKQMWFVIIQIILQYHTHWKTSQSRQRWRALRTKNMNKKRGNVKTYYLF